MLRKSLIIMAVLAAFTMNVSAVQIEVPRRTATYTKGRCEYPCQCL